MKVYLLILYLTSYIHIFAQNIQKEEDEYIYVFTRSTTNKKGFIAEDFNIKDSLSTHVGIGFFENGKYQVYNVDTLKKSLNQSSLVREDFSSFVNVNSIHHAAIWSYRANKLKIKELKDVLKQYEKKIISFDKDFSLDNAATNLYCSEFVFLILKEVESSYNFKPIKKELTPFYKKFLKRSTLEYIPVDFFTEHNGFKIVEQKYYK